MPVPPEVVNERKAEVMLMLFGPDDLKPWQREILEKKYRMPMERIWLLHKQKYKKYEDEMHQRKCRNCGLVFDNRDIEEYAYSICSKKCCDESMIRAIKKYPEELGFMKKDYGLK
jgi:hypothetical protein